MKVVVTGGAGFIGSNLARALLAEGREVHVLDDLSTGHRRNVPPGAVFHHGSILDRPLLGRVVQDATYVFHQAALPSVPRSVADPLASNEANVTGTLNVLVAARDAGVRKVVFAASSSAYGNTPTLPKHEGMPVNPMSPYALTKVAGEFYCRIFHQVYGLRTTGLRYFNVYGPGQDPDGAYAAVIPRFIVRALRGEPLPIHGDGTQSRDFTFVADAVRANLLAAASTESDGLVMNVGAGRRTTLLELARLVIEATGSASLVEHHPRRPGDVDHSLADVSLAARTTGYAPTVDVREGIRRTAEWFRAQQEAAAPAAP